MNQNKIDELVDALRAQGLTWGQTNFAVSLVRNAEKVECKRCAKIAKKYGRSDLSTGRQIADEIRYSSDTSEPGLT